LVKRNGGGVWDKALIDKGFVLVVARWVHSAHTKELGRPIKKTNIFHSN
jgi:hypothetical protein